MGKTKKIDFRLVELQGKNKKSRKGTYIALKGKKRYEYYKYNPMYPIDATLMYHWDKMEGSTKGTLKEYQEEFVNKREPSDEKRKVIREKTTRYKKRIVLDKVMRRGIGEGYIDEIRKCGNNTLQSAKEEMLKNIVLNPGVREIIAKEENMKKLKNRVEIIVYPRSINGTVLDEIKIFGKTIEEVQEQFNNVKNGWEITDGSDDFKRFLSFYGYKSNVQSHGKVEKVSVKMIFRKG